jgi:hypothetical protein
VPSLFFSELRNFLSGAFRAPAERLPLPHGGNCILTIECPVWEAALADMDAAVPCGEEGGSSSPRPFPRPGSVPPSQRLSQHRRTRSLPCLSQEASSSAEQPREDSSVVDPDTGCYPPRRIEPSDQAQAPFPPSEPAEPGPEEGNQDLHAGVIAVTPALQVRAHLFSRILSGFSNLGGDARLGLLVKFFFTVGQVCLFSQVPRNARPPLAARVSWS